MRLNPINNKKQKNLWIIMMENLIQKVKPLEEKLHLECLKWFLFGDKIFDTNKIIINIFILFF